MATFGFRRRRRRFLPRMVPSTLRAYKKQSVHHFWHVAEPRAYVYASIALLSRNVGDGGGGGCCCGSLIGPRPSCPFLRDFLWPPLRPGSGRQSAPTGCRGVGVNNGHTNRDRINSLRVGPRTPVPTTPWCSRPHNVNQDGGVIARGYGPSAQRVRAHVS